MNKINHIDTTKVAGIDIETVRITEHYKDLPQEYKDAWRYDNKWKDDQKLAENTEEDLARLWEQNAAFKPEYSKICAISLVFVNKGVLRCKEIASYDESLILIALAEALDKLTALSLDWRLAAHAGNFFDYPYVCRRFIANKMPIPTMLDSSNLEPWKKTLLCTNDLIKSFGSGPGASLLALCLAFDIPFSKSEISGEDVGRKYFEGKLHEVSNYCSYDTIAVYNLLRRLKGEDIFYPKDVVFVNSGEILLSTPLLSGIRDAGKINAAQKKRLLDESKSLSKSEKENLVLFLKAALIKRDTEFTKEENDLFEKIRTC